MNNQIAVLLDKENQMSDFLNVYWIAIFIKNKEWQIQKLIPFHEEKKSRGDRIRPFTEEVMKALRGYHLIVGKSIMGLAYYLLNKSGYEVLEAEVLSTELLEQIHQDYCEKEIDEEHIAKDEEHIAKEVTKKETKKETKEVPKSPMPIDDESNFFLDIITLQKAYPEISTKKALLPFLTYESYQTLTLICSHMMPWLEDFMEKHHLEASMKREEGKYTVIISHKRYS